MAKSKIFCLGLGKTGTTSFAQFLREAGFNHYSNYHDTARFFAGDFKYFEELVEQYDSFDDFPWPLMAAGLANRTDSLFVLTFRTSFEEWYNSLCSHYERYGPAETDKAVYGWFKPHGREAYYRHFYESHNARIRELFGDRVDFLELNPAVPAMWQPLYERLNLDPKTVIIKHEHRDARPPLQKEFQRDAAARGLTYAVNRLDYFARTASSNDYIVARISVGEFYRSRNPKGRLAAADRPIRQAMELRSIRLFSVLQENQHRDHGCDDLREERVLISFHAGSTTIRVSSGTFDSLFSMTPPPRPLRRSAHCIHRCYGCLCRKICLSMTASAAS